MNKQNQNKFSFFSEQFFNFFKTDYGHLTIGIFIAFFAWILIEIDKEYTTFCYTNLELIPPEGYVLSKNTFEKIPVRIKGNGYDLIQAISDLDRNIKIKISSENKKYSLGRSKLNELLQKEINSNVTLDVNLDSDISLLVDKNISKYLEIEPHVNFQIAPGFVQLSEAKLSQDSIKVIGPEAILDTLSIIHSTTIDLGLISENTNTLIQLNKENIPIEIEPIKLYYNLEVDKITEKKIPVNLAEVLFPGKEDSILIVPELAELDLGLPLSLYELIDQKDIIFECHSDSNSVDNQNFDLSVRSKDYRVIIYDYHPKELEIYRYKKKGN